MRLMMTVLVQTVLMLCAATVYAQKNLDPVKELERIKGMPETSDFEATTGYLDTIKSKDFRDRYAKVSLEIKSFYLVFVMSGILGDKLTQMLDSNILRWSDNQNGFTDKERFYLSGFLVINHEREHGLMSDEDFKSRVIGNYQCMNVTASHMNQIKKTLKIEATIKGGLINCQMQRAGTF